MRFCRLGSVTAAGLCLGVLAAASAHAESLSDALAAAYANNPTLEAQRAQQRATDESVPQAKSGWRPTAEIDGGYGRNWQDRKIPGQSSLGGNPTVLRPLSGQLVIDQPLYRGGRTVASTRQAEAAVGSGVQTLRSTEQQVLLNAIQAYLDVLLGQAVVQLNDNNVQVLQRQLRATRDRFDVGEVTRTDVAQSAARLSLGYANLINAQGDLANFEATYKQVIGHRPVDLQPLPRMIPLPANIDAAYSTALAANPDLAAARKTEEASRWAVRVARGQLLPTADIQGTVGHNADSTYRHDHDNSAAIMGQLRIPIYQAGLVSSQVRQALQENSRDRLRIAETQRAVIAQITGAWENLRAARAAIRSFREQVRANVIALDGVSQEAQVGSRTVLDVLDAEQELLNSRVNLVQSERNEYLASFQLLSGLGKLQPRTLGVAVQSYDPAAYYDNVRNKWFDPSAYDFNWLAVEPEKAADQSNGNPPAAEPAR